MKCYVHPGAEGVGTCTNCGKVVCSECVVEVDGKLLCKACAAKKAERPANVIVKKDPLLALILSFLGGLITGGLLLGLGQIYNGQIKKGIIIAIISLFMWAIIAVISLIICCLPAMLLPLAFWLWALYDAYTTANKINDGEPVKDWLD